MKKRNTKVKGIFAVYYLLFLIVYMFFDDGGVLLKEWKDFLIIPLLAFVIASFFTLFTCLPIYFFKLIVK